ncbi:GIN domain-containing protein [Hyphomonas chukchiensis]|uniref:Putative auto-transporter adhesin head GIN domain-containing protein n=1 Tax=Hyphomonas chukchiensis TaxID=1280947 RepID=A0A062UMQ6_9PROT|nr:DUF2807 domain-containing protein [Hyphomonas chukchiensis]KCZ58312.1 hypothetical protein HY30_16530 [Hyphomonas chukchiensis]
MIRIALPLIALAAAFAPIASAESKSFPAGDFTAIDTRGAVDVIFETGPDASIKVEQDEGDFSDIFIEQTDQTLLVSRNSLRNKAGWARNVSLSTKNGLKVVKVNGKRVPSYTIRVTAPALEEVSVANSSSLSASGLNVPTFSGSVSSSSDLTLAGKVEQAKLRASSSADLDAKQLAATNLDLDVSSSADATAKVLGGKLTLEASSSADATVDATGSELIEIESSSSADVEISGTCQMLDVSASSSADVSAGDLKCVNGDIQASSGADVDAYISGNLDARASSGSDITVRGNPESRDVRESSGGDIEIKG